MTQRITWDKVRWQRSIQITWNHFFFFFFSEMKANMIVWYRPRRENEKCNAKKWSLPPIENQDIIPISVKKPEVGFSHFPVGTFYWSASWTHLINSKSKTAASWICSCESCRTQCLLALLFHLCLISLTHSSVQLPSVGMLLRCLYTAK